MPTAVSVWTSFKSTVTYGSPLEPVRQRRAVWGGPRYVDSTIEDEKLRVLSAYTRISLLEREGPVWLFFS